MRISSMRVVLVLMFASPLVFGQQVSIEELERQLGVMEAEQAATA